MDIHTRLSSANVVKDSVSYQEVSDLISNWGPDRLDKLFVLGTNGSGKSNLIIDKVHDLLHKGLNPDQILILTMTNNSINNLNKIWFDKYHDSPFMPNQFYTFNKFIEKIVNHQDSTNHYKLIFNNNLDQWTNIFELSQINFNKQDSLYNLINIYVNNSSCSNFDEKRDRSNEQKAVQVALNKFRLLTLDQMLDKATKIVTQGQPNKFLDQFQIILIDDFYDLYSGKWLQFIFHLATNKQLFLFGDSHQSIYKFFQKKSYYHRDKEEETSQSVPKLDQISKCFFRGQNLRNTPEILGWANKLLTPHINQPLPSKTDKSPSQVEPQFLKFDSKIDQYDFILNEIVTLVSTGQVKLNDIAILADKNSIIDDLINYVADYNLPVNKISALPMWSQNLSIKFIINLWDIMYSIGQGRHHDTDYALIDFLKNINGVGPKTIIEFYNKSLLNNTTIWQYLIDKHNSISKKILNKTRIHKLFDLLQAHIRSFQDSENIDHTNNLFTLTDKLIKGIPTNIFQFTDDAQFHTFKSSLKFLYKFLLHCEKVKSPKTNLLSFFLGHYHDQNINENIFPPHSSPKSDSIQLSTIHSAKGLEFPITFILDDPIQDKKTDFPMDNNLLYVGATRARNLLYLINVIHPAVNHQHGVLSNQFVESTEFWSYYNTDLSRRNTFNVASFRSNYTQLAQKYRLRQVRRLHGCAKHFARFLH